MGIGVEGGGREKKEEKRREGTHLLGFLLKNALLQVHFQFTVTCFPECLQSSLHHINLREELLYGTQRALKVWVCLYGLTCTLLHVLIDLLSLHGEILDVETVEGFLAGQFVHVQTLLCFLDSFRDIFLREWLYGIGQVF